MSLTTSRTETGLAGWDRLELERLKTKLAARPLAPELAAFDDAVPHLAHDARSFIAPLIALTG
jgi:hypothetical protein